LRIDIERLCAGHLLEIQSAGAMEAIISSDQIINHWQTYSNGDGFIGRSDGKILAAAGVMNLWPGVGEGWAILTPHANGLSVVRKFREMFDLILLANNYHRIQASVRADFKAGVRFAEFLGFKAEGVMRKFDVDKTDYIRMARIL